MKGESVKSFQISEGGVWGGEKGTKVEEKQATRPLCSRVNHRLVKHDFRIYIVTAQKRLEVRSIQNENSIEIFWFISVVMEGTREMEKAL